MDIDNLAEAMLFADLMTDEPSVPAEEDCSLFDDTDDVKYVSLKGRVEDETKMPAFEKYVLSILDRR